MEFVSQQASAVAKIKLDRDNLEREREKIVKQLRDIKDNRNKAGRAAGVSIMDNRSVSSYSNRPVDE